MKKPASTVALSPLDLERFGVRTARANLTAGADAAGMLEWCRDQDVALLIVRCPMPLTSAIHRLESAGGRLMGILVRWTFDFDRHALPQDEHPARSRLASLDDLPAILAIARAAFQGYEGHYHADPRLDRAACDEVYVSWTERSLRTPGVADAVLLLEDDTGPLAFVTARMVDPLEGEVVLGGVRPSASGQGLYRAFLLRAMAWCRDRGARRVLVSTRLTNTAVQKVWARLGFSFVSAEATFHVWFD
jgi:GNAT superfamily N-acetyltransferase